MFKKIFPLQHLFHKNDIKFDKCHFDFFGKSQVKLQQFHDIPGECLFHEKLNAIFQFISIELNFIILVFFFLQWHRNQTIVPIYRM